MRCQGLLSQDQKVAGAAAGVPLVMLPECTRHK